MWYLTLLLIILVAYLLEAIIPLSLLLVLVIAQAFFDDLKNASLFAFVGGILTDIALVRPLGQTALFFLVVSLVIQLYRRRFREENVWVLIAATIIISHIYQWLFIGGGMFIIVEATINAILVILAMAFLYLLKPQK